MNETPILEEFGVVLCFMSVGMFVMVECMMRLVWLVINGFCVCCAQFDEE